MIDLDTWIISDTHFYHANIVKYCGRPENHTELMEHNWWLNVKPDDTILHLGDLAMGKSTDAQPLLKSLPGKKLFIRGNHDNRPPIWYREAGFTFAGDSTSSNPLGSIRWTAPDGTRVLFTHYPQTDWYHDWDVNIHGHIHNNGHTPDTPDLDYRNVSVEGIDYRPVRLRDVLYGGLYMGRHDLPDWTGQTHEGERKSVESVILPSEP